MTTRLGKFLHSQKWDSTRFFEYLKDVCKRLKDQDGSGGILAILVEHNHLLVDGNVFSVNPTLRTAAFAAFAVNPSKVSNHEGYSEKGVCGHSAVNCGQIQRI